MDCLCLKDTIFGTLVSTTRHRETKALAVPRMAASCLMRFFLCLVTLWACGLGSEGGKGDTVDASVGADLEDVRLQTSLFPLRCSIKVEPNNIT